MVEVTHIEPGIPEKVALLPWKKRIFCFTMGMDSFRQARAFSIPELLILCALVFMAAFVAIPAAYPYFKKAHHQATTIKQWEYDSAVTWQRMGN